MPANRPFPVASVRAEYEVESMVQRFAPFAQDLGQDPSFGGVSVTARNLAALTAELLIFNDEFYGKDGRQKSALVKMPGGVFREFTTGGRLYKMLRVCHLYKMAQGWAQFDFKAPDRADQLTEMMSKVQEKFRNEGLLPRPKCFLSSDFPGPEQEALKQILAAKGAAIVGTASEATHVVHPDPPGTSREEVDDDYVKVIEHEERGGRAGCRVHW